MPGPSLPADFNFDPKVWSDHMMAYRDQKLAFGAFAMRPDERLKQGGTGTTIHFPFFKAIGDAEEPAVDETLTVEKLEDDSFSATIKEVGKAIGIRRGAIRKSGASQERIFAEVQSQLGKIDAEKIDRDLVAELNTVGNYVSAYVSADATDANRMSINNVNKARREGFGDKADQSVVMFMHSLHMLDLLNNSTSGFLKADANDPMYGVPGFSGRLFGMAVVENDNVPLASPIGGKLTYEAFICKANAFGFMDAEEFEVLADYDILNREWVFAMTHWYAVKGFHGKISALDKRVARMTVATQVSA